MKNSFYIVFSFVFLLASCAKDESANVNQDSIYTIYELFYNSEKDITTAQATFRFGGPTGTLLDLSDPAEVRFNGDNLSYRPVLGVHNREYAGFKSAGQFFYTDLDNNSYTNNTVIIDSIGFLEIDTIDANSAIAFDCSGNNLRQNETVTLTIDGTQQNNFEVFSSAVYFDNKITIILASDKLKRLGEGNAVCTLVRTHTRADVDEGTSEGGRMAVWYTTQKTIYIKQ